jgi:hypothetical protein
MRGFLGVILICISVLSALGEAPSPKYQPGTIMAVTAHKSPGQPDTDVTQYEVSVKVGNTTYVVLYTPPNGSDTVKYALGDELLVLVGSNTLAFNVPASGKIEAPILSRATLPAQSLDLSKACGQYSSLKLQHLSENLALTEGQQAQIMPILSQEAGEVGEICFNPALSRADKLSRYEKIVHTSDEKVKPLLSATQLQELQDLRKEQKQDLKRMIAEQKSSKHD